MVQAILSIFSVVLYVIASYTTEAPTGDETESQVETTSWIYLTEIGITFYFAFDWFLRLYTSANSLRRYFTFTK